MKLTFLLLLSSFTLFGQRIKGVVLEAETRKPLEYVNISLTATKQGTTTNNKGMFNFKVTKALLKTDILFFSSIGYISKKVSFSELRANNYLVYLQIKTERLKEVVIQSTNFLKPKIRFKKLASMKSGVHSFGSKLIDGKIYVLGGDVSYLEDTVKKALDDLNTADATFGDFIKKTRSNFSWESYSDKLQTYTIKNDTWEVSKQKFRKRAYHAINYFNGKLYILGGKQLSVNRKYEYLDDQIELFDLTNKTILIDKTNPHQAINFLSVVYNNSLIVIGGSTQHKKNGKIVTSKKAHIYDFKSGYWYQLSDMPKSKEVGGVLADNTLYLIGGFRNRALSEIESYNLNTGKWKNEASLFDPIEKPALAYHKNIIYIFSDGKISTYNVISKTLNEYDINLFLKSSKLHYYKNKLYVVGGYRTNEFSKKTASSLYSIDINEFSKTKIGNSKKH